jgi:serine/threonine protein kinase
MCKSLNNSKIAHGDLQHDNILVTKDASVYLIDYDSVYVPTMHGYSDIIVGKANYQHPKRSFNNHASEKLDYFSELVIYLSLRVFSIRPYLIRDFDIIQKEQLLFCKEDYTSISALRSSKGYRQAISIGGECAKLGAILERYLKYDNINDLKPFWAYEVPASKIVYKTDVCTKCGKSYYADDDLYCIYCGTKRNK